MIYLGLHLYHVVNMDIAEDIVLTYQLKKHSSCTTFEIFCV